MTDTIFHSLPPPDLFTLSLEPNALMTQPESAPTASLAKSDASTLSTPPPPHRSHSPSNNLKRSSPFQFGSRYLLPTDDPYEFNAWDHISPSASDLAAAETQYAFQRSHAVSPFDATRFNTHPEKWWDKFYSHHTSNFFKDRKWLRQEFPVLEAVTRKEAGRKTVLEVGAGAGNTAFPILKANENPELLIHACDFSKKAIDLIRAHADYDPAHIRAEVWDLASPPSTPLPPGISESSIDVVLLIFIFSALSPKQWDQAVGNVWRVLKPGGEVCLRDYGRGDLAQVRFKKGRLLEENFYVRGDGTRVYFFEEEELRGIWGGDKERGSGNDAQDKEGEERESEDGGKTMRGDVADGSEDVDKESQVIPAFEITSLGVDRRLLINRQKQLKMYRCWMQGRFRKPELSTVIPACQKLQDP